MFHNGAYAIFCEAICKIMACRSGWGLHSHLDKEAFDFAIQIRRHLFY